MGEANAEPLAAAKSTEVECCMCGDYGLLNQLFHCTVCVFRSQHRYCSNLYPNTDALGVCNWCLKKDRDNSEGILTSSTSSSSSSCKNGLREEAKHKKSKSTGVDQFKIKKQRSLDKHLGRLTRNFSDVRIRDIKKELLRGKVRKYRLLEDVCR